jgi:hypothetical protein
MPIGCRFDQNDDFPSLANDGKVIVPAVTLFAKPGW